MPILIEIGDGKVIQRSVTDGEIVGIADSEIGDFTDFFPDDNDLEDGIIKRDLAQKLLKLAGLTDIQRTIIERFFFHEEEPTAIAKELKISRSRVHQVLKQALKKLKRAAVMLGINP